MKCNYCNTEFDNNVSFSNHTRACKIRNEYKDIVIKLYLDEYSMNDISKKI